MRRTVLLRGLAAGLLLSGAGSCVPAAAGAVDDCTVSWSGSAAGDWEAAANWTPARVPVATDDVCVGPGAPTVAVHASSSIGSLRVTGGATLAVTAGVTLDPAAVVVADATLAGPGAVGLAHYYGDQRISASFSGRTRLAGGVQVHLAPFEVRISGTVEFSGGSVLAGSVDVDGGARLTSADGAPGNALVGVGRLALGGTVGIDVPVSGVGIEFGSGKLRLPAWRDLDADGELHVFGGAVYGGVELSGPTVLARTITAVSGGAVFVDPGVVTTGSGAPAFGELARIDDDLEVYGSLSDRVPLTVTGSLSASSGIFGRDAVSVPGLSVIAPGTVALLEPLRLARGAGLVDVGAGARFTFTPSVLGSVRVSGRLDAGATIDARARPIASTISGDLVTTSGSQTSIGYSSAHAPAVLAVGGRARVAGTLTFVAPPARGDTPQTLITAAGGVTGRFDAFSSTSPGWVLQYTPTTVVAVPR